MDLKNQKRVGVFAVASLAGLLFLTLGVGKFDWRQSGYHVYVSFKDVAGLQKNSPVMFQGLEVGRVLESNVFYNGDGARIVLKLLVRRHVKIDRDAQASIRTLGILGEKYVQILGSGSTDYIPPETLLVGQEPADLESLFRQADALATNMNQLLGVGNQLALNLNGFVEENRAPMTELVSNTTRISGRIEGVLEKNQQAIDKTFVNVASTSDNLEKFSADIKDHPWKLLYKTKEKKKL